MRRLKVSVRPSTLPIGPRMARAEMFLPQRWSRCALRRMRARERLTRWDSWASGQEVTRRAPSSTHTFQAHETRRHLR